MAWLVYKVIDAGPLPIDQYTVYLKKGYHTRSQRWTTTKEEARRFPLELDAIRTALVLDARIEEEAGEQEV